MIALGVDIGGTSIKGAAIKDDGTPSPIPTISSLYSFSSKKRLMTLHIAKKETSGEACLSIGKEKESRSVPSSFIAAPLMDVPPISTPRAIIIY